MKARQIIDDPFAIYSTPTAIAVQEAFSTAWAIIAPSYGTDPTAIGAARLSLAEAILEVTTDGQTDAEQIKRLALMAMRISEPRP